MYRRPGDLAEALDVLARDRPTVLAGGTDVFAARDAGSLDAPVLDLSRLVDLRAIRGGPAGWRIGALATWSDLAAAALPPGLTCLQQAAREIGGRQIQNRGTLGGNLCNASPAADGVPPLLALDARVELASGRGTRELAVAEFVLGNRRTALAPDELLTAVRVPAASDTARSVFLKLGHRRYLVISVVMLAAFADVDDADRVTRIGIAVGACSAAACRLTALEQRLLGAPRAALAAELDRLLGDGARAWLSPLTPIDDVRGTAAYRLEAATVLLRRAIAELSA